MTVSYLIHIPVVRTLFIGLSDSAVIYGAYKALFCFVLVGMEWELIGFNFLFFFSQFNLLLFNKTQT